MNRKAEALWLDALSEVLNRSHLFQPDELADAVGIAVSRLGIQVTIYLVDDEQRGLRPIPQDGRNTPDVIGLDDSLPGRVFRLVQSMPTANSRGVVGADGQRHRPAWRDQLLFHRWCRRPRRRRSATV
jgi:hypothetical protein